MTLRQDQIDALSTTAPQLVTRADKLAIAAAPPSAPDYSVAEIRDARISEATLRRLFLDKTLGRPLRLPTDPVEAELARTMWAELDAVPPHWRVEIPFELPAED